MYEFQNHFMSFQRMKNFCSIFALIGENEYFWYNACAIGKKFSHTELGKLCNLQHDLYVLYAMYANANLMNMNEFFFVVYICTVIIVKYEYLLNFLYLHKIFVFYNTRIKYNLKHFSNF